jgi:hypothetical protein
MKHSYSLAVLAAGMCFAAGSAVAGETLATLSKVQSPVMVNQGDAYVPARDGMKLGNGDQLLVMQGGAALVNYATGCELRLGGNEVLRIAATDACSAPSVAAVNAQIAPPTTSTTGGAAASGGAGGVTFGLVATLAVAGWAAYEVSDDDNLEPISR